MYDIKNFPILGFATYLGSHHSFLQGRRVNGTPAPLVEVAQTLPHVLVAMMYCLIVASVTWGQCLHIPIAMSSNIFQLLVGYFLFKAKDLAGSTWAKI